MTLDLTEPRIIDWLRQFDTIDQPIAADLLTSLLTVSADELASGLTKSVLRYAAHNSGPIALDGYPLH